MMSRDIGKEIIVGLEDFLDDLKNDEPIEVIRAQRCDVCEGDQTVNCWKCQGQGVVSERGIL